VSGKLTQGDDKMTRFVVYAQCSLGHMLTLVARRRAAGISSPLRISNSEWYGISSHDTQEKAQAWLDAHRSWYEEYDKWSIEPYTPACEPD